MSNIAVKTRFSKSELILAIKESATFSIAITEDERWKRSAIKDIVYLNYQFIPDYSVEGELPLCFKVLVTAKVRLVDDHTFKLEELEVSDTEEISTIEDDGEPDIQRINGDYELKPALLAVFYSLIPLRYSKKKLTKIVQDEFVIYSEDEYLKEKAQKSNPFQALKDNFEE